MRTKTNKSQVLLLQCHRADADPSLFIQCKVLIKNHMLCSFIKCKFSCFSFLVDSQSCRAELLHQLIFVILVSIPPDGETGQPQPNSQIPSVAALQLLRWRRAGRQPPVHRHFRGETFCHRGGRGEAHRDLHEELCALQEACERVSLPSVCPARKLVS